MLYVAEIDTDLHGRDAREEVKKTEKPRISFEMRCRNFGITESCDHRQEWALLDLNQ